MPKVNVYLPDDLAEAVSAQEKLNVSGICQQALRKELQMLEAQASATNDIEEAAVRLRASRQEHSEELRSTGYDLGAHWAKDIAEWSELEQLDEELDRFFAVDEYLAQDQSGDVPQFFDHDVSDPFYGAFVRGAYETFGAIKRAMK